MYRRINGKTIISIVLCIGVVLMAIGYSLLSTNLTITGGASITTTWDIRITGITHSATGSAYNVDDYTYTNDTAKFKVALIDPGDSMTYTITIENKGTLTAILNTLDITESGTSQIIYEVSGLKEGDTLAAGASIDVTVVARYNSNATEAPDDAVKSLKVGLTWVQYANQSISAGTYTISYNANGGTGSMSGTTCTVGSNCTLRSNTFTKSGYAFKGWSTESTGAHVYTDGQVVKNLTSSGKTVTLYAIWKEDNSLVSAIFKDNVAYADNVSSPYVTSSTGIDFSAISSDTNGKGLYYTSTNTEDNKTTYYFRGAVDNNYVKFGNITVTETTKGMCMYNGEEIEVKYSGGTITSPTESDCLSDNVCYNSFDNQYFIDPVLCGDEPGTSLLNEKATYIPGSTSTIAKDLYWRIIRINEDGSIRLIYNGTSVDATGDDVTIGTSAFNTNYDDNAYVGYMYGTAGSSTYSATHANTNSSTIKGVIDNWYLNDTNLSSYVNSHLADAGFCNDRSVASSAGLWYSSDTALGYGTNITYYGAYNRLYTNKDPQFACPNASNDLFTTSSSGKGNKALTNPIGLITADELWYAGATTSTSKTHYLYTGSSYWTTSSFLFNGSHAYEWFVYVDGNVYNYRVNFDDLGVRPVANLQSGVEITGGDGTSGNPYIIK